MLRINEYQRGLGEFTFRAAPATVDAEERREEAYRLLSRDRYRIVIDLVENSLEALVNMGALEAAREELQILVDLGHNATRWERRIRDAERKTA